MPDRIVRVGIISSDAVNALDWGAEVFYRRLMSVADDFGRYDGRVSILRAQLYALKLDRVSEPDIAKWIGACQDAGLVRMYTVDDKAFLEIVKFGQRVQQRKSKWPVPVDSSAVNGESPLVTESHGDSPPIRRSDSESYSKSETYSGQSPFSEIMPKAMQESGAFCSAWNVWVADAAARGRPLNLNTARIQFIEMSEWTIEEAVQSLKNAVSSRHSRPFKPDEVKGDSRGPTKITGIAPAKSKYDKAP